MFFYLANNPNSSLSLDSTIKCTKLKHNNVFENKIANMRFYLIIYNIMFLYVFV